MAQDTSSTNGTGSVLHRENFIWMIAGVLVIILGFVLMAGGGSDDPDVFNYKAIYSPRRITIAPAVVMLGFAIEIAAIFRKPKKA